VIKYLLSDDDDDDDDDDYDYHQLHFSYLFSFICVRSYVPERPSPLAATAAKLLYPSS